MSTYSSKEKTDLVNDFPSYLRLYLGEHSEQLPADMLSNSYSPKASSQKQTLLTSTLNSISTESAVTIDANNSKVISGQKYQQEFSDTSHYSTNHSTVSQVFNYLTNYFQNSRQQ